MDSSIFPIEEDKRMSHDYDEVASDEELENTAHQVNRCQILPQQLHVHHPCLGREKEEVFVFRNLMKKFFDC